VTSIRFKPVAPSISISLIFSPEGITSGSF
jgi:hypothetical protein